MWVGLIEYVSCEPKNIAGPTPHKVQFLVCCELRGMKNTIGFPFPWTLFVFRCFGTPTHREIFSKYY